MKHIAVLGSTGSIGKNTLDVIARFPKLFRAAALSANTNIDLLSLQIEKFRPESVCVGDEASAQALKKKTHRQTKIVVGEKGLIELCKKKLIDKVVVAVSGAGALVPLLEAIAQKKEIALANKEALVMAGSLVMKKAARSGVSIVPIDSEQSAIWQCMRAENPRQVKQLFLTASGGPFRKFSKKALKGISVKKALQHPRWQMGRKITVDSATLMNKGLEVIEAMHLFNTPLSRIKVVVHPESIIHSMVEFIDGVVLAQLSETDMRIPIQYALSYPERLHSSLKPLDFFALKALHFEKPDVVKFPCLRLAYEAAEEAGVAPCVLNAANEVCVEAFLEERISFVSIPRIIERLLERHKRCVHPKLKDILEADVWARNEARKVIY